MKAVELINRAYNLSGIVSRDLDQVQGSEGKDGIFWLNQIVALKSDNGDYLPYYGRYEFVMTPGVREYLIPGYVSVDTVTFFMNGVRFSLVGENRRRFFGDARPENIMSLPYQYYYEKGLGGMKVFFYFNPNQAYPSEVVGLTSLPELVYDTELDDIIDSYYQTFLMFELAEYLCMWNQMSLPPAAQQTLSRMRKKMYNINPKDFRINKVSLLSGPGIVTLGVANLSNGWIPI